MSRLLLVSLQEAHGQSRRRSSNGYTLRCSSRHVMIRLRSCRSTITSAGSDDRVAIIAHLLVLNRIDAARKSTRLSDYSTSRDRLKEQSPFIGLLFEVRDQVFIADHQLSYPRENLILVDLVPLNPPLHLGDGLILRQQRGLTLLSVRCDRLLIRAIQLICHIVTTLPHTGVTTALIKMPRSVSGWRCRPVIRCGRPPSPPGNNRDRESAGRHRPYFVRAWRPSSGQRHPVPV